MTHVGADLSGSPDRFGYEWAEYTELRPIYEEQFLRWTALIARQDWRGKRFLDVGCGMGRNSHWPMTYGASGGAAIDVDDRSLASAKRTLARWPGVTHFLSLFPTILLWTLVRLGFGRIEYFDLLRKTSFRQMRSIVFDQMLPRIANYWRRDEVVGLLRGAGLTDIATAPVNGLSWTGVGTRPDISGKTG